MIEKQREIISLLAEFHSGNLSVSQVRRISKALIQRYPQILAEKVWEGERLYLSNIFEWAKGKSENIEIFIREVVS